MQYLRKILLIVLFFFLFSFVVIAFDFSICDTPERAIAELGDDYYAFCESNVAPAYYSNVSELAEVQTSTPDRIYIPEAYTPPEDEIENNLNNFSTDMYTNNLVLIVGIIGVLLLISLIGLIMWRKHHHKHITIEAVNKILPTMRQYVQAGWTPDQMSQMLITQGYDMVFIKQLLKALDQKP